MTTTAAPRRERTRAPRASARVPREPAASASRPRRRLWRSLWIAALSVAILLTLAIGVRWVLHSSYFAVRDVVVSGEVHESAAAVITASGLGSHPAMVDVNAAHIRRALSEFPWIGSVSVVSRWPHTVDLTVHEVTSVAVAFTPHHELVYVSAAGRALGPAPLDANLVTLATTPSTLASSSWPFQGPESAAAGVAAQLPPAFANQVREVISDAHGNVTLQLTTPLEFFLGPATNLHAKFVAVASAIAHATFAPGDIVDVTTPSELSVTGPSPS